MSTKVRNSVYELKRKNPITLGDDSNIEANLKPIKIDSKNSILELSENELKVRGTIDASAITVDGASVQTGSDATDTEVDFRAGNKQKLTLTNNVTDIHFQFPHVSGNFICVLLQDGTGSRTISNWKTKDADGNAGAGNSGEVLWAGGSAPSNTETANKADIASFYWDADNEIAYGTYAYNF